MKTYTKNIFILSILLLSNILNANEYIIRTNFENLLEYTIFAEEIKNVNTVLGLKNKIIEHMKNNNIYLVGYTYILENETYGNYNINFKINITTVLDLKNKIIEHMKNNNIYLVGYDSNDLDILHNKKTLNDNEILTDYQEKTFNFIVKNVDKEHTCFLENKRYGNCNINFKINITDEYKEKYLQNMLFQILKEKKKEGFAALSRADFLSNIELIKKDSEINKYQYELKLDINTVYFRGMIDVIDTNLTVFNLLNKVSTDREIINKYNDGAIIVKLLGKLVTGKYLKDSFEQKIISEGWNITHFGFLFNSRLMDDNALIDIDKYYIFSGWYHKKM